MARRRERRGRAHSWIRSNVLGLLAIFLALNGTAVAVQTKHDKRGAHAAGAVATASPTAIVAKKKARRGPPGPPGPQGAPGPQGPPGLSTGPAGGDLTGSYPNPQIASGVITDAEVAGANKDGLPGVPSLRTLGTGAQEAMPGDAQPGGPPTGNAGGALAGDYPNPTLNVSGGPCANGKALTDISAQAVITCGVGVFSDGNQNLGVTPTPIGPTSSGNTAVGSSALSGSVTGNANTAIGGQAMAVNTSGGGNSALGYSAALNNTTGSGNTAVGYTASSANQTGNNNTSVGQTALQASTSNNNTAVGQGVLDASTTGSGNSAVGQNSLGANTTGGGNSSFGQNSLDANTTGGANTAAGLGALGVSITGNENAALGHNALGLLGSGSENTALGHAAGLNLVNGSNDVYLGSFAGPPTGAGTESNTLRIGFSLGRAFISGIRGVTTSSADAVPVLIDSAGQLGTASSSRTVKRDITPLDAVPELMKLKPISFRYRTGPPELHYGLIAEQVAKVLPELAVYGKDGRPETVQYQELPALLLAKVQDQQRQIKTLRAETRRLDRLEAQVKGLMQMVRGGER